LRDRLAIISRVDGQTRRQRRRRATGHGMQTTSRFGQLLKQYRQEAGLTQEEVAERAELSSLGKTRLTSALWPVWFVRGAFAEARRWIAALLSRQDASPPTPLRARLLFGAGRLAYE
jgi:transcriptional regulator with XRE-family HTH domain